MISAYSTSTLTLAGQKRSSGLGRASDSRRGSVLIFVLVMLGLLAALLFQMQATAVSSLRKASQRVVDVQLQTAQDNALRHALKVLATDPDLLTDHPSEAWAQPISLQDPLGYASQVIITDANRWFDLNNLRFISTENQSRPAEEILHDLFRLCGDDEPEQRIRAIVDWVDKDSDGPFEDDYYSDLDPAYSCANDVLTTFPELYSVALMERTFFERARSDDPEAPKHPMDTFTVLPSAAVRTSALRVNVNSAPRHVLLGIVGPERSASIEQFIEFRKEQAIPSIDPYLSSLPEADAAIGRLYFDVRSTHFEIYIESTAPDGQTLRGKALIERGNEGEVEVLQWHS